MRDFSIDSGIGTTPKELNQTEYYQVGDEALRPLGDDEPVYVNEHQSKDIHGCDDLGAGCEETDEQLHEEGASSEEEAING